MKLRVRGSTIRLRLTKPEVDALRINGRVEEAAELPGGARFRYALEVAGDALNASFDASGLVVRVSQAQADHWCGSDEVGIEGKAGPSSILIEKDWACVQPRSDENPADMYEHPLTKKP